VPASSSGSGYLGALSALARAGVDFVLVGVGGINFYARDASESVETRDLDVFLAPRVEVLRAALAALQAEGFSFQVGREPFLDIDDPTLLATVLERGATIEAHDASEAHLDLMLSGLGLRFDDLSSDAVTFRLGEVEVKVGRLEKLLRAKELLGRPKDVEFLRLYAARLREQAAEG
jgi:predicted nucleotidyltransferase